MKKIFVLILCASLAIIPAACASENKSTVATSTVSQNTPVNSQSSSSLKPDTEPVKPTDSSQNEQARITKDEAAPKAPAPSTSDPNAPALSTSVRAKKAAEKRAAISEQIKERKLVREPEAKLEKERVLEKSGQRIIPTESAGETEKLTEEK